MEIREVADREDVRGADRVNRRAWREGYSGIVDDALLDRDPPADAALDDRLAAIGSWTGTAFVAVEDGAADRPRADRVVGYAIVRWGDDVKEFVADGDAGLKEIYVDPAAWNEGVGTALLEAVEAVVPEEYDGLTLSMLAGNDRASAFYEARGFERVGEWADRMDGTTYETVLYRKPLD